MTTSDSTTAAEASAGGVSVNLRRRRHYWQRFDAGKLPPGVDLAALRRGIDRKPGTVPAMWPFYTTLTEDGRRTRALYAEHLALTLFAVHQQSKSALVHKEGVGLGTALLRLKQSGKFSPEAVDRRFAAAATATSLAELGVHLRGLITQLRALDRPELDYTRLAEDLRRWQHPDQAGSVRRAWGGQYFAPRPPADDADSARPTRG